MDFIAQQARRSLGKVKSETLRLVRERAAPLVKNIPIERYPGWLGYLIDLQVPRRVKHQPKSPLGTANINILIHFVREAAVIPGDIAECGVYRGGTLVPMALYVKQHGISKTLIGFDSWAGFSEEIKIDMALGGADFYEKYPGGLYASYDDVRDRVKKMDLQDLVILEKGFFIHTLQRQAHRKFAFVHIDSVTYQSYKDTLVFFYPRMSPGGVILFDEYNDPPWPGCNKAVDEVLSDKPEKPMEIESEGFQKWYIRKQ